MVRMHQDTNPARHAAVTATETTVLGTKKDPYDDNTVSSGKSSDSKSNALQRQMNDPVFTHPCGSQRE